MTVKPTNILKTRIHNYMFKQHFQEILLVEAVSFVKNRKNKLNYIV